MIEKKKTNLRKRLLIWAPISISCILIFLLVFLSVYSSYSKRKPLRKIMNSYDTYELMIEDEKKLQEIYPEPEQLIFNVKIEGVTNYSYIIEGIDYCKNWHSNEYCPRMRNRRIYIEGTFEEKENQENCHFMIAFKSKTNSVYDDLKWSRSGGGAIIL
ncbi:MAG: hypothetical protein K2I42_07600 [Anaeroplasmataceae bacterium]|nr:hypothetical protein [Anaeroplasmataceae bacterium]